MSDCYGVLIHIVGGEDLTLEEVAVTGEMIMDKVPNTKRIIWGAKIDNNLTGKVRLWHSNDRVWKALHIRRQERKRFKEPDPEPVPEPEPKPEPPSRSLLRDRSSKNHNPKVEEKKGTANYIWYDGTILVDVGNGWRFHNLGTQKTYLPTDLGNNILTH